MHSNMVLLLLLVLVGYGTASNSKQMVLQEYVAGQEFFTNCKFLKMEPSNFGNSKLTARFGQYEIPLLTLVPVTFCMDRNHPGHGLGEVEGLENAVNTQSDSDLAAFLKKATSLDSSQIADFVDYRTFGCSRHKETWRDCDAVEFVHSHPPKCGGESIEQTLIGFDNQQRRAGGNVSYDYCCPNHSSYPSLMKLVSKPECAVHIMPIRDPKHRYISALRALNSDHMEAHPDAASWSLSGLLKTVNHYSDSVGGWPGYFNANFLAMHFAGEDKDLLKQFGSGKVTRDTIAGHIERMDFIFLLDDFQEAFGLMSADMQIGLKEVKTYYQDHTGPQFETTLTDQELTKLTQIWHNTYSNMYFQEAVRKYQRMKRDITNKHAPGPEYVTRKFECDPNDVVKTNHHISQTCARPDGEWVLPDTEFSRTTYFYQLFS